MYFNGTGIWGGETMSMLKAFHVLWVYSTYSDCILKSEGLNLYLMEVYRRCNKITSKTLIRKSIIEKMVG